MKRKTCRCSLFPSRSG